MVGFSPKELAPLSVGHPRSFVRCAANNLKYQTVYFTSENALGSQLTKLVTS